MDITPEPSDLAAVGLASERFELSPLMWARGSMGPTLSRELGASVELADFRSYVPGDDPRHIDWAAFGRTGDLTVRRYQDEVESYVDVVLDLSRSMAIDDGTKPQLARRLCLFFARASRSNRSTSRAYGLGEGIRRLSGPIVFDAPTCRLDAIPLLRPRGLRILISDFMTDGSPRALIRKLARGAARCVVIRILGPWESAPTLGEQLRLVDSETGRELTLRVDEAARGGYLSRVRAITHEVRGVCTECGVTFVDCVADADLNDTLERDFLPLAVVTPR